MPRNQWTDDTNVLGKAGVLARIRNIQHCPVDLRSLGERSFLLWMIPFFGSCFCRQRLSGKDKQLPHAIVCGRQFHFGLFKENGQQIQYWRSQEEGTQCGSLGCTWQPDPYNDLYWVTHSLVGYSKFRDCSARGSTVMSFHCWRFSSATSFGLWEFIVLAEVYGGHRTVRSWWWGLDVGVGYLQLHCRRGCGKSRIWGLKIQTKLSAPISPYL